MASHGGRYVIAFNGEIYNFRSLRAELVAQGHVFRGGSDTEVLLAAIEEHGLAAALNRISGMFAFEIGRAHVWTPVPNAHIVCRLLLEKKKITTQRHKQSTT